MCRTSLSTCIIKITDYSSYEASNYVCFASDKFGLKIVNISACIDMLGKECYHHKTRKICWSSWQTTPHCKETEKDRSLSLKVLRVCV